MALTLEQVNAGLEAMGKPKLDKLPEAKASETTSEEKKEDKKPEEKTPAASTEIQQTNLELSDDKVLEYLKSKGITASNLDELKPKEASKSAEEIAEEKENNKISYALQKGLFNKKEYENFIADSRSKEDLVLAQYISEAKKEDPELTDEELQEEFNEKYGLNAQEGSRKFKRGQEELNLLADRIMKTKYKKVFDADSAFDEYQAESQENAQREKLLKDKTPVYKTDVESAISGIKEFPVKFSETEEYKIEVSPETIAKVKEHLLKPTLIQKLIEDGYTKEELNELAFSTALRLGYGELIDKVSTAKAHKNQAGARGIVEGGTAAKPNESKKKLTPEQQRMLDMYKPVAEQQTAN